MGPLDLPPRLPLPTVLDLAGYGRSTLRNRQRAHLMPEPIDRGARGGIYDRDAVLKALGIAQDVEPQSDDPWKFNRDAFRARSPRKIRRPQEAG